MLGKFEVSCGYFSLFNKSLKSFHAKGSLSVLWPKFLTEVLITHKKIILEVFHDYQSTL